MLGWLKGLWAKLFSRTEGVDPYREKDRLIFGYFNGQEWHKGDPITLYKRVMERWAQITQDASAARNPHFNGAAKAHSDLVENARWVFGVKSLEEGGLTEAESINLLDRFLVWADDIKKNWKPPQTPPEAPSAPTPPSSDGNPPTPSSLGSGSTESAPSTEKPTLSPLESALAPD